VGDADGGNRGLFGSWFAFGLGVVLIAVEQDFAMRGGRSCLVGLGGLRLSLRWRCWRCLGDCEWGEKEKGCGESCATEYRGCCSIVQDPNPLRGFAGFGATG